MSEKESELPSSILKSWSSIIIDNVTLIVHLNIIYIMAIVLNPLKVILIYFTFRRDNKGGVTMETLGKKKNKK